VSLDSGPRDSTTPPRLEPAFRGVAALLARARQRRYLAEQNRAEDDALPPAHGVLKDPQYGEEVADQVVPREEPEFYNATSENLDTSRGSPETPPQSGAGSQMAPRRAA